jgi:uncharacterized membrane protein
MKIATKLIGIVFSALAFAYVFGTFLSADFNMRHWDKEIRHLMGTVAMLGSLVMGFVIINNHHEEPKHKPWS